MNIGCLFPAPIFGIGGLRLWEKEEAQNTSRQKRKIRSIIVDVDLYDFFLLYIIYCLLFYYDYTNTPLPPPDLWHLSHQGKLIQQLLGPRIQL